MRVCNPAPAAAHQRPLRLYRAPQDDSPWDELCEPLVPAASLEVLRINRCLGLQLSIEGAAGGAY